MQFQLAAPILPDSVSCMKMLISMRELGNLRTKDSVPCECRQCGMAFSVKKPFALRALRGGSPADYCSRECGFESQKKPKRKMLCDACGILFQFEQARSKPRRFCSFKCANRHHGDERMLLRPRPHCKFCGRKLDAHRKKTCSRRCHHEFRAKEFIARWKAGDVNGTTSNGFGVSGTIRKFLWEKAGGACMKCGWNTPHPKSGKPPLQVNHKDGDAQNSMPGNLELICPNCHSLTENFGNRNKKCTRNRKLHLKYR